MAESFKAIISEALKATWQYFRRKIPFDLLLLFLLGLFTHAIRFGLEEAMSEFGVWISFSLVPVGLYIIGILFWNIIKIPFKNIDKRQGIMIVGFVLFFAFIIHLLPFGKLDVSSLFQNKEKKEVKLLINSTIDEIDILLRQKKMFTQFLKENKVNIADAFNKYEISFYESTKLKILLENKIFQKYLPKISITLLVLQRSIKDTLAILNDKNNKSGERAIALIPYLVTLKIIREQLKLCIKFIDNEITRQELTEKINTTTQNIMEDLTKAGNWIYIH